MARSRILAAMFLFLYLAVAGSGPGIADELSKPTDTDAKPQLFYLHTEFLPYETTVERGLPYRLGREIIRQAVLIAARDELGVATCDETLHETPSAKAQVIDMLLIERSDSLGKANVKLIQNQDHIMGALVNRVLRQA